MADYGKIEVTATYSKKSDFSSPKVTMKPDAYNPTTGPDEFDHYEVEANVAAAGSGTTVDLSKYATVNTVVIKNNDATNTVTARFRTGALGATNIDMAILAGQIVILVDVTAANNLNLAAAGAVIECEVFVMGT